MLGYKGFDKDFCCRGLQYEVGKTYRHDGEMKLCESGFHFCDTPLAVFEFYPPTSRFAVIEATGQILDDKNNQHKFCTNEITIIKELSLQELICSAVEAATNTGNSSSAISTGNYSTATNTGDYSTAISTGNYSAATNTGYRSTATNTGDYSTAISTGNYSAATNTGYRSTATNTGNYSAATNTGYRSTATNTGNYSTAISTGYRSAASVSGEQSIAVATGCNSKAKGNLNCWIVLCEYQDSNLIDVQAFKVDGITILPDTFYKLVGGKPVPADD